MDKHFQNTNGGNSPLMKSDLFHTENLIKKIQDFSNKNCLQIQFYPIRINRTLKMDRDFIKNSEIFQEKHSEKSATARFALGSFWE